MTPEENPKPIIFSEWSFLKRGYIKRKDYTLKNLLDNSEEDKEKKAKEILNMRRNKKRTMRYFRNYEKRRQMIVNNNGS